MSILSNMKRLVKIREAAKDIWRKAIPSQKLIQSQFITRQPIITAIGRDGKL
jgi:hypothetical protein